MKANTVNKKYSEILREIQIEPWNTQWGICSNFEALLEKHNGTFYKGMIWLDRKVKQWPKYSGIARYPVPGGCKAYDVAVDYGIMWSKTARYGRMRRSLLQFLINEAKKEGN